MCALSVAGVLLILKYNYFLCALTCIQHSRTARFGLPSGSGENRGAGIHLAELGGSSANSSYLATLCSISFRARGRSRQDDAETTSSRNDFTIFRVSCRI